ncbi:MAG: AbrB/MazE/SpoVT family DNA-binding domain-containing protein [Planctomycetes bacterium]|nr:AbrB/MazE/SpoVT family DNA-binding domain-containing protein [Planctomycetota bacterium]
MTLSRLVRISGKGQFVIPKEMREALDLKAGKVLLITLEGERIVLADPRRHAQQTKGLLKGTWGSSKDEVRRYLEGERDAWE